MEKLIIILSSAIFVVIQVGCANIQGRWPKVNEFQVTTFIDTSINEILLEVPILDNNGKRLYLFICRGGSQKYLDQLYEEKNLVITPPLNCAIYSGDENEASLLSEDESPSWHSRGQIYFDDIIGDCADYPEFGATRNFYLRGFSLTLHFEGVKLNENQEIVGFNMVVALKNKPDAVSPKAKQTGFLPPKNGDCRSVNKGYKILKCRNLQKEYSWDNCEKSE